MKHRSARILSLLLALVLCLGLLPTAVLAEEEEEFTITLDASPGKFSDGNVTKTIQTHSGENETTKHMIDYPREEPVRDGYYFKSWYLNDPMENPSVWNMNFTADATLKAYWVPNDSGSYVLKLDPNGGTCPVESVSLSLDGHTAPTLEEELPTPTREGYTFEGWFVGDREVKAGFASGGNETAVAKWSKVDDGIHAREIWFHLEGGTVVSVGGVKPDGSGTVKLPQGDFWQRTDEGDEILGEMLTDDNGKLSVLPEMEKEGYVFDGWYTARTGGTRVTTDTVFKGSGKYGRDYLWARWSEADPDGPFTVKFDLNYKNPPKAEIPEEQKLSRGQTVDLPDGKKLTAPFTSHEFYAWCMKGEDGKLYPWQANATVTANMTLYAGWIRKGTVVKAGEALPADSKPADSKPAAPKFTDVGATSPFAPAIAWAVEQGITNGKTATTFGPGDPCTRAQIVTFLWRAAGSPEPKLTETQYMDVTDSNAYYYKAVQWAAEKDMEYAGTFDPHKTCTRASAVYFIWKAFGSSKAAAKSSFADMPEEPANGGQWYWPDLPDAVDWAVEKGVTTGKTADTFAPTDPCTRGQIVTFLYRAYVK